MSGASGKGGPFKKMDIGKCVKNVEHLIGDLKLSEEDFEDLSPVEIMENPDRNGMNFMEAMFDPNELVNIVWEYNADKDGKADPRGSGKTMKARHWEVPFAEDSVPFGKAGAWIRINPMLGNGIADKDVASFRYSLLEWDEIPIHQQMALVGLLALPIAALVTSGNKSLHAWVRINASSLEDYKKEVKELYKFLRPFGVDPHNCNPSRLSRMPGAFRSIPGPKQVQQKLLYLNPNPKPEPIYVR